MVDYFQVIKFLIDTIKPQEELDHHFFKHLKITLAKKENISLFDNRLFTSIELYKSKSK